MVNTFRLQCILFDLCSNCLKAGIHNHRKMEAIHNRKAIQKVSHPAKNVIRVTYGKK